MFSVKGRVVARGHSCAAGHYRSLRVDHGNGRRHAASADRRTPSYTKGWQGQIHDFKERETEHIKNTIDNQGGCSLR
jgi:hypothetical protein